MTDAERLRKLNEVHRELWEGMPYQADDKKASRRIRQITDTIRKEAEILGLDVNEVHSESTSDTEETE